MVFHLGGDTSGRRWAANWDEFERSFLVNLAGTLNLLRALHGSASPPRRLIRSGGLSEYGGAPVPFEEGQREMPLSAYGASQAATTMMLSTLSGQLPFSVVTLRLASVYGPGRSADFFLPSLIMHCLEGREFEMTAGERQWDLVYIDDAVDAFVRTMHAEIPSGEIINIGAGPVGTLRELAERVAERTGMRDRVKPGKRDERVGEIRDLYCSNERAQALLGWKPRVSLEEGLDRTISWYREHAGKVRAMAEWKSDVNA